MENYFKKRMTGILLEVSKRLKKVMMYVSIV